MSFVEFLTEAVDQKYSHIAVWLKSRFSFKTVTDEENKTKITFSQVLIPTSKRDETIAALKKLDNVKNAVFEKGQGGGNIVVTLKK